jgi:hypothetical protein
VAAEQRAPFEKCEERVVYDPCIMGFLGVYRAAYDYAPQGEGELEISEGDLLYVLEKGEDDWWKAKKKASQDDDDEPIGLIPNNYVEEVG